MLIQGLRYAVWWSLGYKDPNAYPEMPVKNISKPGSGTNCYDIKMWIEKLFDNILNKKGMKSKIFRQNVDMILKLDLKHKYYLF